jgi:hypothetical protein
MNTAIVVDTPHIAKELNKLLPEGSRAYIPGQTRLGARYEQILVMATMADDRFSEWFDHFTCCLTPGGRIYYD